MEYNKKYIPFILFGIIILYAIYVGFRMPNLWSINYYLPSFFDSFYRRALPGTILSLFGDLKFNYYTIASIQFLVLTSLLVWIYYFFQKNILLMLLIGLYLISPAGGYLFHEVGYIDQLLYLILFISIAMFKKHKIISILLFSSSMWIHELTLFVTLPIYFTYLYIETKDIKKSILYILPSIFFFLLIYLFFQTVSVDNISLFKNEISNVANYKLRSDFYTVFTNELTGARNKLYYNIGSLNQLFLLAMVSALTAFIVYEINKRHTLLSIFIFIVGMSPLALGIFGWDISRWYFLSLSSLTVILIVVMVHYKVTLTEILFNQKTFILYIIFYSLLISNMYLGYFDGYKPRLFNKSSVMEIKNEFLKIPNR